MGRLGVEGLSLACACAAGILSAADIHPYGVCAHVTRSERGAYRLKRTIGAMELAGIRSVRCDFDRWSMKRPDGNWDFANYDALANELETHGITILPILYGDKKPPFDMEEYKEYIRTIVRHFKHRLPAVEIWNEANLRDYFRESPQEYAKILKAAYEAVKSVDPSILVAYTGTAGVPSDWIRKTFEAGAGSSFDIMNVHPYSHPAQPECSMDTRLERLRLLMAEFGIAEKPIWITEIGWPTHTLSLRFSNIILSGLKVARPEQKTWKMIMIDFSVDGPEPDQSVAEQLEELLPCGSEVVLCTQSEANRRLSAGGVDAVVYPFDEYFPSETIDSVNEFIRKGGVLVEVGGLPCYFGRRNGESVKGMQHGGAVGRFPFGYRAWWTGAPGTYPASCQVFATERGLAAGVKQEPTGFKAERFLVPDRAGKDAEWIPLIAGKTATGTELVGAAVIRYHGDRKGAAVLCSLYGTDGIWGTNSEENQAKFTARGAALAFAEGVRAYFPYVLRAYEDDPFYSEDHFGLMHADFQPKPAYSAYANFTRERPEGSVNMPGEWHDGERTVYYPQWKRPDGKIGGVVWRMGEPSECVLRFKDGEPHFRNIYGCKLHVRRLDAGAYRLMLGDSPVYFSGAELVSIASNGSECR